MLCQKEIVLLQTKNAMKKYINSLEECKEYYMGLVVEFQNTFYDNTDYFFFMSSAIDRAMNINRGFITLAKEARERW